MAEERWEGPRAEMPVGEIEREMFGDLAPPDGGRYRGLLAGGRSPPEFRPLACPLLGPARVIADDERPPG